MIQIRRLIAGRCILALTIALLLVLPVRGSAQDSGRLDGYWWTGLPFEFKFGFILGYQEGIKSALGHVMARGNEFPGSLSCLTPDYLNSTFFLSIKPTCGAIEKELEAIYTKEENKPLYIYSAITIALMRLQGKPEEEVQETIRQFLNAKKQVDSTFTVPADSGVSSPQSSVSPRKESP
ncbi:MAG TPA: hypothetical protein PLG17_02560 [Thermodesulfobacteriota bacterium]|nr:hypothetical protein [Deltaproteobacteria bacterium]HNR12385.1 hypothetical protein [Thermodesulfobacteriota bacterium]HNU71912.1 hypothetical protein [Thermodesulfobacteriota bacterium]HOC38254.1 hypothetical protein [Thermodesulfobacteriota bacterium]HQO77376.1 hypothetical protein [Thermodesulfobacteriota bacterium]